MKKKNKRKKNHGHNAQLFQAEQGDFRPKSKREIGPSELTLTLVFPLHKFWRTEREIFLVVIFLLQCFGVIWQEIFSSVFVIPLDENLYAILTHIQSNYQRCVENWPKCVYPLLALLTRHLLSMANQTVAKKNHSRSNRKREKKHAIRWDLLRLWLDDICYPLDTVWLFELLSFSLCW